MDNRAEHSNNGIERVVVIGGGVAGLIAAVHLAERGLRPVLLEAEPEWIGGRLRGGPVVEFEHCGRRWQFPGEHGMHGIWSPYYNLLAVLERHSILPEMQPSREEAWIFRSGQRVRRAAMGSAIHLSPLPAPFHYLYLFTRPRFLNMLTVRDLASLPRILASLLVAMSIDPLAERRSLQGETLATFTHGWSPNVRSFFAALARNALAAHPEEVPASGFISFLRFYTLLRRDAWGFKYLRGTGAECVTEPLAGVARRLGCTIRMGARVTCLDRQDERWRVIFTHGAADESVEADRVVLALDSPAAARLLAASPATSEAAAGMRFPTGVPTAIFRLWYEGQPNPLADSGVYSGDFVADNFFWLHRLQPAYAEWSAATGGSAIEMHIYGPPEILAQPDVALLARVITETNRAFPELGGRLVHAELLRNEANHTLFSVGEPGEHLEVTTPWPGMVACGDWVYYPTPAMYLERAATTGIAAANATLASLGLPGWPILAHPEPEWLAGKIERGLRGLRHGIRRLVRQEN